jgi:UPF0755 protein
MKKILPIFLLFIFLSSITLYLYTNSYIKEYISTPNVIEIPKGSTKQIVEHLVQNGIDLHWFDKYLIKRYGVPQAGWIELSDDKLSREEIFKKITHSKAVLQKVTLIPGETTVIFLKDLSKKLNLDFSKMINYYKKISPFDDGVIIADTYSVPKGINEEKLIDYLLRNSLKKHKELSLDQLNSYDEQSWFKEIITKASIIQKEAANRDEMPIISGVIDNRIKKKMKLQMDGALNYGEFSHIKVTAKRIKKDNTTFNTYKYFGLPASPVSSVSIEAIKAAINPKKVDYLYFVKGKDNKHKFSKTYKEHLKNIKHK